MENGYYTRLEVPINIYVIDLLICIVCAFHIKDSSKILRSCEIRS